ncbi:MAG: 4Fe-4S dicluster domain-containing protein [Planctomycetes bacterium]|nr:4Fe-4S dicluster domain-containing protein [Planctomycetota bacterium]
MSLNRRDFLKVVGLAGTGGSAAYLSAEPAQASEGGQPLGDAVGVLVDIPNCIGCRSCEYACQKAAGFDVPALESFSDKSAFAEYRRPAPRSHTVVNAFDGPPSAGELVYAKINCLHCNDPACVSACLVGAFRKQPNGAVTYDAWKCIGCRYCMVACPFQIPTYEYDNALTPQVRKCTLCFDLISQPGGVPACVRICPTECLTFGKRSGLLDLAHEKIRNEPDRYVDHVYGEHEVGGTSWLYLSSVPFEELNFVKLDSKAPPRLTESIQHAVFKRFVPPLAWYGLLGAIMWLADPRRQAESAESSAGHRE